MVIGKKLITFGSDFEMFTLNQGKNIVEPCPAFLGGTKKKPRSVGKGCTRQIDGVTAEGNIPPVMNENDWLSYINYCVDKINTLLNKGNYEVVHKGGHEYTLNQLTESHHWESGCTPSISAYSGKEFKPNLFEFGSYRTTGFHIHMGIENLKEPHRLIQLMDKYVGVNSIEYDTEFKRRELYGLPGEFRLKQIDNLSIIEYRTLSGDILKHNDYIIDTFRNTQKALIAYFDGEILTPDEMVNNQEIILNKKEIYV